MQGRGVKQDAKKGTRLLLQAVDLGVGLAAFEIGMAHRWGHGATKDEGEAKKWFQKSAELGYPDGQYISARFYETDGGRRLELYLKAASGGHAGAQYELGRIYHLTPELYDRDKAVHWYSLAALNGNQMGNQGLFKLGLPDVNGNQPINSKVMTSSASTEKLDGHTTVAAFVAAAAIAVLLSTTVGGDGSDTSSSSEERKSCEPCAWGEREVYANQCQNMDTGALRSPMCY